MKSASKKCRTPFNAPTYVQWEYQQKRRERQEIEDTTVEFSLNLPKTIAYTPSKQDSL